MTFLTAHLMHGKKEKAIVIFYPGSQNSRGKKREFGIFSYISTAFSIGTEYYYHRE
jgi:hypothetical protein